MNWFTSQRDRRSGPLAFSHTHNRQASEIYRPLLGRLLQYSRLRLRPTEFLFSQLSFFCFFSQRLVLVDFCLFVCHLKFLQPINNTNTSSDVPVSRSPFRFSLTFYTQKNTHNRVHLDAHRTNTNTMLGVLGSAQGYLYACLRCVALRCAALRCVALGREGGSLISFFLFFQVLHIQIQFSSVQFSSVQFSSGQLRFRFSNKMLTSRQPDRRHVGSRRRFAATFRFREKEHKKR